MLFDFLPNPLVIPVGLIIGVLVAAPVGPVNVLCVQRAVERGFSGGLAAGLGAVLGDGSIALAAGLGVGQISGAIQYHRAIIQVIGAMALIGFATKLAFSRPKLRLQEPLSFEHVRIRDYIWDVVQTFFLTITNPGAVLGLIAIFGGVSTFLEVRSTIDAMTMVASIMIGSLLWWVTLSHLIGRIRHRIDEALLARINIGAAVLLAGFGLILMGEVVMRSGRF